MVELSPVSEVEEVTRLKALIERHAHLTRSATAQAILTRWDEALPHFVKVMSVEYKKVLAQRRLRAIKVGG
jgi:glutamate synthase domain-containing protein 3